MSTVTFKSYGSGPTTLFCFPGWIHPIEKEPKFLELLSKKYTVVSVQLPGYVDAADSKKFVDFTVLAQEVNSKIQEFPGNKKVLLGFSMGARFIMEMDKLEKLSYSKIFVGAPVGEYIVPFWAKLLLSHTWLITIVRRSSLFKQKVVNIALQTISNDPNHFFRANTTSLNGAFDSLLGLIKTKHDFKIYAQDSLFIYGDGDSYLQKISNYTVKQLIVIKNAPHNCVNGNEKQVVKIISEAIG